MNIYDFSPIIDFNSSKIVQNSFWREIKTDSLKLSTKSFLQIKFISNLTTYPKMNERSLLIRKLQLLEH